MVALISLLASAATSAQQPTPSSPRTPTNIADQYADLGQIAYRGGSYATALAHFGNAFKTQARPLFLYNMGRCLQKLGRYREGADRMSEYLQAYARQHNGQSAPNQDAVLALVKSLREKQSARRARVLVGSNPPGASVTRVEDGRALGITPLKLQLKPGIYKLRLSLPDHQPLDADLEVPESEKVRAMFTLTRIREKAAISVWVNVRRAKIELNGAVVAVSPYAGRLQVKPGRHVLRISKPGYAPLEEIVAVPKDKQLDARYVLHPATATVTWRSWAGWSTLAVGLGGVGGGVAAGVEADRHYRDSAAFSDLQLYQNVGWGLGSAGAIAGLGLVLWDAFRNPVATPDLVAGKRYEPGKKLKPLQQGSP